MGGVGVALALGLVFGALGAPGAEAKSVFLLASPSSLGSIPASTYDTEGRRIGAARLQAERVDAEHLRILFRAGTTAGARLEASALLASEGEGLRVVQERSESFDPEGHSVGVVEVDHLAGRARCRRGDGTLLEEVALGADDRVMNVPMNLFFQPLLSGKHERLAFQVFLCRGGAKRMDFEAWLEPGGDPESLQVRYGPDFGLASALARRFAPRLSLWFGAGPAHPWRANRLPLYSGGPEVVVVRDGISAAALR